MKVCSSSSVDCSWDMWGTWSSCTVTCGGGSQTSKRTEAQQVQNGGQSCTGESTRQRNCNEEGCSGKESMFKQDHWISENKCALLPQLIVAGVCGKHGAHAQKLAEAFEHPKERSSKKHRMVAQNVWERWPKGKIVMQLAALVRIVSYYRKTHLVGEKLLLALIWDVLPSCLGSRQLQ